MPHRACARDRGSRSASTMNNEVGTTYIAREHQSLEARAVRDFTVRRQTAG